MPDNLYQNSCGVWCLSMYLPDPGNPLKKKRFRKSTGTKVLKDAKNIRDEYLGKVATGEEVSNRIEKATFEDLVKRIKAEYDSKHNKTDRLNTALSSLEPFFRGLKVKHIGTEDAIRYAKHRGTQGVSDGTIRIELGYLKNMLNLGLKWTPRLLAYVPYIPLPPKSSPRKTIMTMLEAELLFKHLPRYTQLAMIISLQTGNRLNTEVLCLKWSDNLVFHDDHCEINLHKTKNKETHRVYITGIAYDMLRRHKLDSPISPYVFYNPKTGSHYKDIRRSWRTACKQGQSEADKVGETDVKLYDFTEKKHCKVFHDTRRTLRRWLDEHGVSEKGAMDFMNHKSLNVSRDYNVKTDRDKLDIANTISGNVSNFKRLGG